MKGNNCQFYSLIKFIFSLLILSFSIGGSAKCQDDFKPSDSIEFKLFFDDDKDEKPTDWQVGLMGGFLSGSNDNNAGYGGALLIAYDRFTPFILRLTPNIYWSEFERIIPGENIVSFNLDFDLLVSSSFDCFKPYAGLGLNYYNNSWPTDEPAGLHEFGPYDQLTKSAQYDYGDGIAHHLRFGLQLITDWKVDFILDFKLTNIKAEMPVIYQYTNGEEEQGYVDYKLNPLSIYLGISSRIKN